MAGGSSKVTNFCPDDSRAGFLQLLLVCSWLMNDLPDILFSPEQIASKLKLAESEAPWQPDKWPIHQPPGLVEDQKAALEKAIRAKHLMLLHGPPDKMALYTETPV